MSRKALSFNMTGGDVLHCAKPHTRLDGLLLDIFNQTYS